jgi:hypothetical protein
MDRRLAETQDRRVVVGRVRCMRGSRGGRSGERPEREHGFVEGHVPKRDDTLGGEVVAAKSAVVGGVPDEDACGRARTQLVRRRGGEVGVAQRAEDAEEAIVGRATEQ